MPGRLERMKHPKLGTVSEMQSDRALFDAFSFKPDDTAQKVDLLDAFAFDALAEFGGLRGESDRSRLL